MSTFIAGFSFAAQRAASLFRRHLHKFMPAPSVEVSFTHSTRRGRAWQSARIHRGAKRTASFRFIKALPGQRICCTFHHGRNAPLWSLPPLLLKTRFKINKQLVECGTGTGKYAVSVTLAPELRFKDGVATNVVLHVDDIKGATLIKGVA
jgi:hypothetical protein